MEDKIIYEVLRIIDYKPLFLEKHINRMRNSFQLINMNIPFNEKILLDKIAELIKEEGKSQGNIKITYSLNNEELKVFFIPHSYPTKEMYEDGVKTILYFGERENPNAKIINDDFRSKVNKKIEESNAYEAILVDRNGFITEGSRSNIFAVIKGRIVTSPVKAVLPGVTRDVIIELIKENNMDFEERPISYKEISQTEGMFISGTSPQILPINCVNDIKIQEKNKIIINLMKKYEERVNNYIKKSKK